MALELRFSSHTLDAKRVPRTQGDPAEIFAGIVDHVPSRPDGALRPELQHSSVRAAAACQNPHPSLEGVAVPRKVAIVHDWLTVYGGAERVLEQILALVPHADLFTLVDFLPEDQRHFLNGRRPRTSFIQKLPFAAKKYRSYLPVMPYAIEQFDLSAYPLVISSSYAVAKGVLTGPDQLHISYVHSPARYAWDLYHQYLEQSGLASGVKGLAAKYLLHHLRMWDTRSANSVDTYVANSEFIARRIQKYYRRDSTVIYPPVDISDLALQECKNDYYVTASRLVPYKRVDLIVQAFRHMPDRRLIVVGDGPEYRRIQANAPNNVQLVGYQSRAALTRYMQGARAFIVAAEEDFGIVPLEAQACGTAVIAFGKGGVLETIRGQGSERPTGAFFTAQTTDSIAAAISDFESHCAAIDPASCRMNAMKFGVETFRSNFGRLLAKELKAFSERPFSGIQSDLVTPSVLFPNPTGAASRQSRARAEPAI
jgi:glycosyltransferase involved in cell wall biosynthesis